MKATKPAWVKSLEKLGMSHGEWKEKTSYLASFGLSIAYVDKGFRSFAFGRFATYAIKWVDADAVVSLLRCPVETLADAWSNGADLSNYNPADVG